MDVHTIDPLDQPERWRANLGTAFSDLVPGRLGAAAPPEGALRGGGLGPAAVFTVRGTPQTVERTTPVVRRSPSDMVKVCIQLSGRATVHQDDREVVIAPGQLALYDIGRPYALRLEGAWTCAVMAVQRDQLAPVAAGLTRAMARPYPARSGPGLLLSQFITATVGQLDTAGPATAGPLGAAGACLLAGVLAGSGDVAAEAAAPSLRDHAMAYIRARLSDPHLSRASVAAAHRMSPRTLDRLFDGSDWSVSGYIRHQRLEAVRRDLADPALAHRGVAALAARWCFVNAAHFSRLFRDTYGYPPSVLRPDPGPR